MHTYRKVDLGWQAAIYRSHTGTFEPIGPIVDHEWEAAALACFLNGGRYSPGEVEHLFRADPAPEDDDDEPEDHTTPPSKSNFEDYPHEAIAAARKLDEKRSRK